MFQTAFASTVLVEPSVISVRNVPLSRPSHGASVRQEPAINERSAHSRTAHSDGCSTQVAAVHGAGTFVSWLAISRTPVVDYRTSRQPVLGSDSTTREMSAAPSPMYPINPWSNSKDFLECIFLCALVHGSRLSRNQSYGSSSKISDNYYTGPLFGAYTCSKGDGIPPLTAPCFYARLMMPTHEPGRVA